MNIVKYRKRMQKFKFKFYLSPMLNVRCKVVIECHSLETAINKLYREISRDDWPIRKIKVRRLMPKQ